MNTTMTYEFDVKLKRMALHATTLSYWQRPDMQLKLKQYYYPYGRKGDNKLYELMEAVIKKIDPSLLPSDLYSELVENVNSIGRKMDCWFKCLRRKNVFYDQSRRQLYDKFFKDIYWTHYGTIDEVNILKNSWVKIPNVDLRKMYILACSYCCEELIDELWGKISKKEKIFDYKKFGLHLVAYWNMRRENRLHEVMDVCGVPSVTGLLVPVYDLNQSPDVNMLRWAVVKGIATAVKYFWYKLTEKERNKNLEWCLNQALKNYKPYRFKPERYRGNQYDEISFFLMNFLNYDLKIKIFRDVRNEPMIVIGDDPYNNFVAIIEACFSSTLWKEFLTTLFNDIQDFLNEKMYGHLINRFSSEKNHFLLLHVWGRIPCEMKSVIATKLSYSFYLLLKKWDLATLGRIIHDPHVNAVRLAVVNKISDNLLLPLMNYNEEEKLIQLINKILIPRNLDVNIQEALKLIYEFVLKGKMNSINLTSFSAEEIDNLKSFVYPEFICRYFVTKNQFELADEFLNWKFVSEENVKNFKEIFKNSQFTMRYLCDLWKIPKKDVESAKIKSENFLGWLVEDVEQSKSVMFMDIFTYLSEFEYASWHSFIDDDHHDILEDFSRWCLVDDEAIKKFKKKVIPRDLSYFLRCFIEKGRFEEASEVCDWFCEDKYQLSDFITKFLTSLICDNTCYLYIAECCNSNVDPTEKFKNFIDFFGKVPKSLKILKTKLKEKVETNRGKFEEKDSDNGEYPVNDDTDQEFWENSDCADNFWRFFSLLDDAIKDSGVGLVNWLSNLLTFTT